VVVVVVVVVGGGGGKGMGEYVSWRVKEESWLITIKGRREPHGWLEFSCVMLAHNTVWVAGPVWSRPHSPHNAMRYQGTPTPAKRACMKGEGGWCCVLTPRQNCCSFLNELMPSVMLLEGSGSGSVPQLRVTT